MSRPPKTFYITTPIYYVNDRPHIGHAYTSLACDVLARFKRLDGWRVQFLTGTDEHGQKVEASARKRDMSPQAFTDEVSQSFRDLAHVMRFSHDDFIRTTEERHTRAAQELWRRLEANGWIYLDTYAGWYSVRDEAFYQESELVDGLAPTGAPVEWVEEPSYFFKLSAFQEKLLAHYEAHPECIAPESRRNEVVSFVESGLKDLSISRTGFAWGVPVPHGGSRGESPPLPPPAGGGGVSSGTAGATPPPPAGGDKGGGTAASPTPPASPDSHVMYVWLDALTNYLSALGWPEDTEKYRAFWPADVHVVGKDILRFHAVYWPAFLMGAGLPLPRRIFAHGWWTNEGQKISKSLGNVIDPLALVETYGLDPTRYFLMREVPFGNDGNFSRARMAERINAELANTIGNLAQRTLSMIAKHCDGEVPDPRPYAAAAPTEAAHDDVTRLTCLQGEMDTVRQAMEALDFTRALEAITGFAHNANLYIDHHAPWKLRKEDPVKMRAVLYHLAERIRHIAILLQPFTPDAAAGLLVQLGYEEAAAAHGIGFTELDDAHALPPGAPLPPPAPVFPRFVEEEAA